MSALSSTSFTTVSPAPDARLAQLTAWLDTLGLVAIDSRRPASADASFRRYFRFDVLAAQQGTLGLGLGPTLIAMDAPPERENVAAFIHVAGLLQAAGVNVPAIVARDVANGFLLLSDLGATTYLQQLTVDNAGRMYSDAVDALAGRYWTFKA